MTEFNRIAHFFFIFLWHQNSWMAASWKGWMITTRSYHHNLLPLKVNTWNENYESSPVTPAVWRQTKSAIRTGFVNSSQPRSPPWSVSCMAVKVGQSGCWVGKSTHPWKGITAVRSIRERDADSFLTHFLFFWIQFLSESRSCVLRGPTAAQLQEPSLPASKYLHNCLPTSQHSLMWVKCVLFTVFWVLSPLPHRDGDIPASENKGKHYHIFTPSHSSLLAFLSFLFFAFSLWTCCTTSVFVVMNSLWVTVSHNVSSSPAGLYALPPHCSASLVSISFALKGMYTVLASTLLGHAILFIFWL